MFGMCNTLQGDLLDGLAAYKTATEVKPDFKEAWFNKAQASGEWMREYGRVRQQLPSRIVGDP